MSHAQQENGNGRSVMKLTVPLPQVIAMFIAGVTIAIAIYAKLVCIDTTLMQLNERMNDMVSQDDLAWYATRVAVLNKDCGLKVPDVSAYFREKRIHINTDAVGTIQ